jgi:uncharacterized repeat protein (TIGR03803 family)
VLLRDPQLQFDYFALKSKLLLRRELGSPCDPVSVTPASELSFPFRGVSMLTKRVSIIAATLLVIAGLIAASVPAFALRKERVLWHFNGLDGWRPVGSLVFDSSGNLYGVTSQGGAKAGGEVFRLSPKSYGRWTKTVLHDFCSRKNCSDGVYPPDGLTIDTAGNLYGTTWEGGEYGAGVVFQLSRNTKGRWTEKVLHSFGAAEDGSAPQAGVTFDAAGNLYGTTIYGGTHQCQNVTCGVVFQLSPGQNGEWTESVIHNFQDNGSDGYWPATRVTVDSAGNLYGTTIGGGVVFKLAPGANGKWTEKIPYFFTEGDPSAVILDAAGNLYGTTDTGTRFGDGAVFELIPDQKGHWREQILHYFHHPLGASRLIFDTAGNLYATTAAGGRYSQPYECSGCGTAFELSPGTDGRWTATGLHDFGKGKDGVEPDGSLVFDSVGNLYGVTFQGGIQAQHCLVAGGCGTVFEIMR